MRNISKIRSLTLQPIKPNPFNIFSRFKSSNNRKPKRASSFSRRTHTRKNPHKPSKDGEPSLLDRITKIIGMRNLEQIEDDPFKLSHSINASLKESTGLARRMAEESPSVAVLNRGDHGNLISDDNRSENSRIEGSSQSINASLNESTGFAGRMAEHRVRIVTLDQVDHIKLISEETQSANSCIEGPPSISGRLKESRGLAHRMDGQSARIMTANRMCSRKSILEETQLANYCIGKVVDGIMEIIRAENPAMRMEERLEMSEFAFDPDVVEKVLMSCFKVDDLALRFFNWVRFHHGFQHTTGTFNAMINIAGEAGDVELLERLVSEMEEESCPKNMQTWTMIVSCYGNVGLLGKALWAFEKMRKSGLEPDEALYKALIRGLCNGREAELALEFYREMVSRNIRGDDQTYNSIMYCLSRERHVMAVRWVGDDMMRISQVPELEAFNRMLKCFCNTGRLDEARKLISEMRVKNLTIDEENIESLVKGLCSSRRVGDALKIIDDRKQKCGVNGRFYGFIVDGYLRNGDILKAYEILNDMITTGCLPSIKTFTQVIQSLFRSDEYEKACKLYSEMLENGLKPNVVIKTVMVAEHTRQNCISEAWKAFESLKQNGMNPTRKAYSVFIEELCGVSKPDEAFKLLKEMYSKMVVDDSLLCLVASSFNKNGELEMAKQVENMCRTPKVKNPEMPNGAFRSDIDFNQIPTPISSPCVDVPQTMVCRDNDLQEVCRILSSTYSWSSMQELLEKREIHFTPCLVEEVLYRCQRHGHATLCFFSWVSQQPGYRHTTEMYNMAIKISGSGKDFKHMTSLFLEMGSRGCSPTLNTWNIMITQYGRAGLMDIMLKKFKQMKQEAFKPNRSTYKFVIVFLCEKESKKADEAIKIFQEMICEGHDPDNEVIDAYYSCLCEVGKLSEAKRCVEILCERGLAPQNSYTLLVKSLCRTRRLEEAMALVDDMVHLGCVVDKYIYGSIVYGLLKEGCLDEALAKVESMRTHGISPTTHIYTSLMIYYLKKKQLMKAMQIFKKMKEDGCDPSIITYSALIRGYVNQGMISDAWDVFHKMKVKGPSPDFKTYSMFISCLCKVGRSVEGLELIDDMRENGFTPSAVNFRSVFNGLKGEGKQDLAKKVLLDKWHTKRRRKFLSRNQ